MYSESVVWDHCVTWSSDLRARSVPRFVRGKTTNKPHAYSTYYAVFLKLDSMKSTGNCLATSKPPCIHLHAGYTNPYPTPRFPYQATIAVERTASLLKPWRMCTTILTCLKKFQFKTHRGASIERFIFRIQTRWRNVLAIQLYLLLEPCRYRNVYLCMRRDQAKDIRAHWLRIRRVCGT